MRKFHVEYKRKSSVWDSISACTPHRNRVYETRFRRVLHVKIESLRLGFLKVKPSLRQSIFRLPLSTRLGFPSSPSAEYPTEYLTARHWSCLLGAENISRHWSCLFCFISNVQCLSKREGLWACRILARHRSCLLGAENIWHWSCRLCFILNVQCLSKSL